MASLIENLKDDHDAILRAFAEANRLGIGSKEGRVALFGARERLLLHLYREDYELYPQLRQLARADPLLASRLASFDQETTELAAFAAAFFERYDRDSSGVEFAKDAGRLEALLSQRIRREEAVLYPRYVKARREAANP